MKSQYPGESQGSQKSTYVTLIVGGCCSVPVASKLTSSFVDRFQNLIRWRGQTRVL